MTGKWLTWRQLKSIGLIIALFLLSINFIVYLNFHYNDSGFYRTVKNKLKLNDLLITVKINKTNSEYLKYMNETWYQLAKTQVNIAITTNSSRE